MLNLATTEKIHTLNDDTKTNEMDQIPEYAKRDVFGFYKILQSPWQNLFIDIRDANIYQKYHARYTVNIPIKTSRDNIFKMLKSNIEAQQNIIQDVYIYANIYNKEAKQHVSIIETMLKDKPFLSFPRIFVFIDENEMLFRKYSFLCQYDDEKKEDSVVNESKVFIKMRNSPFSLKKKQKKNNKKSYMDLYNERVGNFLMYPDQILNDKLFLGDIHMANSKEILKNLCISHVVNVTMKENVFENDKTLDIKYFQIPVVDVKETLICEYFDDVIEFMDIAMKENINNKIYVHCARGVSRSSTIIIAYLMKINVMSYENAIQFVQKRRSIIDPNIGFIIQLKHWGKNGYKMDLNMLKQEMSHIE